ncbi:MAG: PD-(D/E)XK nuclease family transposase [Lachnospiraceae bacterium]|nr:PD-(D/E)XK nuclease family transposase [Lachnospiraceae bacterium]
MKREKTKDNRKKKREIEKIVDNMCLFDDDLMSRVFDGNIPAAKLIIDTLLEKNVEIKSCRGQVQLKNPLVNGRSIILDILAGEKNGDLFNCEVQRKKRDANPRRARFHSSMMDARMLKSNQEFRKLKDSYMIFITKSDYFGKNRAVYRIDRKIDGTDNFNDGSHIIYVNGNYRGDDRIGRLMEDFSNKGTTGFNNPELEKGVRYFKKEEGREKMCEAVERYATKQYKIGIEQGIEQGIERGIERGIEQKTLQVYQNCIERGMSDDDARAIAGMASAKDQNKG